VDAKDGVLSVEICRAASSDLDAIADAHLDSIRTIGPRYYADDIVTEWASRVTGSLYANAMARGETFFIAICTDKSQPAVLGFSSHRVDEGEHRTAVYVRGSAARRGVGSALFRAAEAQAISAGATCIHVDASLAAVEFYKSNGFNEIASGEHVLWSGLRMPCVFMKKELGVGHRA
jgi:putative acetyltransferase